MKKTATQNRIVSNTISFGHSSPMRVLFLLLLSLVFACKSKNGPPVKNTFKNKAATKYDPVAKRILFTDSASFADRPHKVETLIDPTLSDTTILFSEPDSASATISLLPPMSKVAFLDTVAIKKSMDTLLSINHEPQQELYLQYHYWIKVKTADNLEGYISQYAIANYVFQDPERKIAYLILTYPSKLNAEQQLTVIQYDLAKKKILSSVTHWYYTDYEIDAKRIKSTPLKNIKMLISIRVHGDFCGGGESTILVGDAGGKVFLFPDQYNFFSEGESFDNEALYMPYNYKGELYLLANNDESKLAFPSVALLPYPPDSNIPHDELLVMKKETGEYNVDKEGRYLKDKEDRPQIKSIERETTYYRWDGVKIRKVKSIIKKKRPHYTSLSN